MTSVLNFVSEYSTWLTRLGYNPAMMCQDKTCSESVWDRSKKHVQPQGILLSYGAGQH